MASKKSGRGLSSSAGLVTYYDADNRTAIHISPKPVLIVVAVVGVAIYLLNLFFSLVFGSKNLQVYALSLLTVIFLEF